jgi:hypothetical protein
MALPEEIFCSRSPKPPIEDRKLMILFLFWLVFRWNAENIARMDDALVVHQFSRIGSDDLRALISRAIEVRRDFPKRIARDDPCKFDRWGRGEPVVAGSNPR